jgi:hypothetical protein
MPQGEFTLVKRAGEKYLHWFAGHPGNEIGALALVSQLRGPGIRKVIGDLEDGSEENEGVAGLAVDHVDGVVTAEGLGRLRDELRGIRAEREKAEEEGNWSRVDELHEEVTAIETRIGKDTNRFGKIRRVSNDDRKAVESIARELRRAYARVKKGANGHAARKAFLEHFEERLTIGVMCRYRAADGEHWFVIDRK